MKNILIAGGSGLIGQHLSKRLREKGYHVSILSRSKTQESKLPVYIWDIEKMSIDSNAIDWADVIINLAGENISNGRWTKSQKKKIVDSRIKSTELIFHEVSKQNKKLETYISSSAIGIYGTINSDKTFKEENLPANDFLGKVCQNWELAADNFNQLGIRTVKIRTGVVLAKNGGALTKMMLPVKLGLGSALGSGKQFISWIHIEDLVHIYIKAIEDKQMKGAYNAIASNETNKIFTKTLAKTLKKPLWLPNIPGFLLKMIFGEMSEILLKGNRISNQKLIDSVFIFKFNEIEKALENILES